MKLAVVHYHLNPGGVTRVIANQLLALEEAADEPVRVLVMHGCGDSGWPQQSMDQLQRIHLQRIQIPCLGYTDDRQSSSDSVSASLRKELIQRGFEPHETVIHVHNHSLGKNASLTSAITDLAQYGYGLLLQIHDFAEDFRPKNYRLLRSAQSGDLAGRAIYPVSDRIHYAVLNRRDQRILGQAGLVSEQLHLLPNPISPFESTTCRTAARKKLFGCSNLSPERPLFVYPVRGIRRKNLGEMILWSTALRSDAGFVMTLAPMNPSEQGRYREWVRFCDQKDLRILFNSGAQLTFEENIAAADWILSTSVAEGFGMVFLESWLAGRGFAGRNLPEITNDFVERGIGFEHVYERLTIPHSWFSMDTYLERLKAALQRLYSDYGLQKMHKAEWNAVRELRTAGSDVDFADLDESLQREVIQRVSADARASDHVRDQIIRLGVLEGPAAIEEITQQQQAIHKWYSLRPSGERLRNLLQQVVESDSQKASVGALDPLRVLKGFLDITRLRLIRS